MNFIDPPSPLPLAPEPSPAAMADAERDDFARIDGRPFFRIGDSDRLPPFLTCVPSNGDHWMFAGSNAALTAGRGDADHALFPYCTQDQLFDRAGAVGSIAMAHLSRDETGEAELWEPWAASRERAPGHARSVLKNFSGSMLVFEEVLARRALRWRHTWSSSDEYGIIRRTVIENLSDAPARMRLLDGIQNIMPGGLGRAFQDQFSNLADAYKRSELLRDSGAGLFYLSSIPTDRAEPNEGLYATMVWPAGVEPRARLLSTSQVDRFRRGGPVETEREVRGRRGAFLIELDLQLEPGTSREWWLGAEVARDARAITRRSRQIRRGELDAPALARAMEETDDALIRRIAQADGLQSTADTRRCWRHFSNALFNSMRGGIPAHGHRIEAADLLAHIRHFNKPVFQRRRAWLERLPASMPRADWIARVAERGDPDLGRLVGEYLPLTFSRRHGDPSRPWNRFSIETQGAGGRPRIAYQGNWRDIFQNWEAMLRSYPCFGDAAVARFLNASTADGHNPYRISDLGFEWERVEPDQPWSNIGYWGDHQIAYLLKLLEAWDAFEAGGIAARLDRADFVHANVPYRIAGYSELLADPGSSVRFDADEDEAIRRRVERVGADGRLLRQADGTPARATLIEKLLTPLLAKLANFVPDSGIWMNTQRPEWNDANNALAGRGVSVVTLGYLYRYVGFLARQVARAGKGGAGFRVHAEVGGLLRAQRESFDEARRETGGNFTARDRRRLLDGLGASVSSYRECLYREGFSGRIETVPAGELLSFLETVADLARRTLLSNRRADGLYHSYNLLRVERDGGIGIDRLEEMLEGQVAILSSGLLTPVEALDLCRALRSSRLYRENQYSYLLQPDRELPGFLERNRIPEDELRRSRLLAAMLAREDTRVVARDEEGCARFHASFRNAACLRAALLAIEDPEWIELARAESGIIGEIYEATFHHRSFTGRSGSFFAFEGLGSVYWHMVSKLALAVQEVHRQACAQSADREIIAGLALRYHEITGGLGWHKSPEEYGAFPTDAYSHTPAHAGAQQPGMTGQVKEDLLARWGELGVEVAEGRLRFRPRLLRRSEFHAKAAAFAFYDVAGRERILALPPRALAFTVCQTPVIYMLSREPGLEVVDERGDPTARSDPWLSPTESAAILQRTGAIARVTVRIPEDAIFPGDATERG